MCRGAAGTQNGDGTQPPVCRTSRAAERLKLFPQQRQKSADMVPVADGVVHLNRRRKRTDAVLFLRRCLPAPAACKWNEAKDVQGSIDTSNVFGGQSGFGQNRVESP